MERRSQVSARAWRPQPSARLPTRYAGAASSGEARAAACANASAVPMAPRSCAQREISMHTSVTISALTVPGVPTTATRAVSDTSSGGSTPAPCSCSRRLSALVGGEQPFAALGVHARPQRHVAQGVPQQQPQVAPVLQQDLRRLQRLVGLAQDGGWNAPAPRSVTAPSTRSGGTSSLPVHAWPGLQRAARRSLARRPQGRGGPRRPLPGSG